MSRLIVHQPTNHESKRFRYYNIFFDRFINELSKKHDVVTNRYYKKANHGYNKVKLNFDESDSEFTVYSYECEMLIEDFDTKDLYIYSVADDLTPAILNLQSYEKLKKVYVAQFIRQKIDHHVRIEHREKYSPWIYFPSNEYDLDFYYNLRKQKSERISKIYFRGDTRTRPILDVLSKESFVGGPPIGNFDTYVNELINYDVALSVAGRGELCYRDIECFAIGVPIIRFEYLSSLMVPLIPNYHYISVERPEDLKNWMIMDRTSNLEHAELLIKRFNEVKNDESFLKYISENARNYYEKYLSPEKSIELTLNTIL